MFYKPVGITTEIKSGYLKKSPPSKQFKNEVPETAVDCCCPSVCFSLLLLNTCSDFLGFYASLAEIMEGAIFCAVQSGRRRISAEVLQESGGEGQSAWRD